MKKFLIVVFSLMMLVTLLVSCNTQVSDQQHPNSDSTGTTQSIDNSITENLSKWQMAGKGVGKILPEPELEYSLPQYSSFIAAEVKNASYDFFEDYVNKCIEAGFEGNIGTAEIPDYYFNGETANGERVQVMFYEDKNECSISAFPAE